MKFEKVRLASSELARAKEASRADAIVAITGLEEGLREALEGEKLKGLPNIAHSSSAPYRGAQVRTKRLNDPLPRPAHGQEWGREALVMNMDGVLALTRASSDGAIEERVADASDLRAEDLVDVAEAIVTLVDVHCQAAARRAGQYKRLRRLAGAINRALEEES